MPSSISAAMLSEITSHNERVYATFEITLGSTTYRFSDQPVASAGSGMYLKRVTGWDEFERPFADRSYHLVQASGGVQIEDFDNVLGKAIGGPSRGAVLNAVATAHWRSDHVPNADHYKFFDGRVLDWSMPRPRTYHFELGPDVLLLENASNNIPRITAQHWPNAPASVIAGNGTAGQVVYGIHRSGTGSLGKIKCIPVDTQFDFWFVSWGQLDRPTVDVIAVYKNGVAETVTNWNLSVRRLGNIWCTILNDELSSADMDNDTIYIDTNGVEPTGEGSVFQGDAITNPSDQIQHFLSNFVYNAWPEGATPSGSSYLWFDSSDAPLNTTQFSDLSTFFSDRGILGTQVITSDDSAISVLNRFAESWGVAPFWSSDWTLGMLPVGHSNLDLNTGRNIRLEDSLGDSSADNRADNISNKVFVQYDYDSAAAQFQSGPDLVVDTLRSPVVSENMDMYWLDRTSSGVSTTKVPGQVEASSRIIRRDRFPALVHSLRVGPKAAGWDIGDDINYSHWGIPRAASLISDRENDAMINSGQPVYCFIAGMAVHPATREHTLALEELEHYSATFWSTFKVPGSISDANGYARLDTGADKTFTRTTEAWLPQANDQLGVAATGSEKFNDEGFWSEDARTNLITNSNFNGAGAITDWTDNTGATGQPLQTNFVPLFASTSYPYSIIIVDGATDTYISQAITSSSGDFYRVQLWHDEIISGAGIASWRLTRSTDSKWWNDTTETWVSTGLSWNVLPQRAWGEPDYSGIIEATGPADTWTLDIGSAATSGGPDSVRFGQVDIQNTRYALSPLVTSTGSTFTATTDALKYAVASDSARQVIYASRNTVRVTFVAKQNAADMADDDVFTIFYAQFGQDAHNYLAGYYEKPSGGNARFVYEAKLASAVDAQAINEIDIVSGTSYELMFRKTDNSGTELGLKARTLSILVDGVRGTDDQMSGDFV